MTDVAEFLADAGAGKVKFDRYNRYLLPHPDTGREQPWTRVTTFARAIQDEYNITRWKLRSVARGMVRKPELIVRLASEYDDDDTAEMVADAAHEAAGGNARATIGTAMHRFTELIDAGEPPDPAIVPELVSRDLDAYTKTLAAAALEAVHIERIVCLPDLGVAGKLDRVLTRGSLDSWIADLKTGADLYFDTIAIQLALYAHATHMWNGKGWEPMPRVDQCWGIVMWLPYGEATCELWAVDLEAGWFAARELCREVRAYRKRRDLAVRWTPTHTSIDQPEDETAPNPPESDVETQQDRAEWIRGRLMALAADERARKLVAQGWADDTPERPPWTEDQIMSLAALLDRVEAEVQQSFGASDPQRETETAPRPAPSPAPPEPAPSWPISDDGVVADETDHKALETMVGFADEAQLATLQRWAQQALREQRSFSTKPLTRRMCACSQAAIACAFHLGDDERVRRALTLVIGSWTDSWVIGAVFGSLNFDQAHAVITLAEGYAAGTGRGDIDPV